MQHSSCRRYKEKSWEKEEKVKNRGKKTSHHQCCTTEKKREAVQKKRSLGQPLLRPINRTPGCNRFRWVSCIVQDEFMNKMTAPNTPVSFSSPLLLWKIPTRGSHLGDWLCLWHGWETVTPSTGPLARSTLHLRCEVSSLLLKDSRLRSEEETIPFFYFVES